MKKIDIKKLREFIPKKRYLLLAAIIIYLFFKYYPLSQKEEDNFPSDFKNSACNILLINAHEDSDEPS